MSYDKKQVNEEVPSYLGRRGFLMAAAGTASALLSKSKLAANGPSAAAALPAARAGASQEPLALDGGKPKARVLGVNGGRR